jgi:Rho family, other
VKLCLVALKCDLRDDEGTKERLARHNEKCISYDEGLAMAKHIRAVRYLGSPPKKTFHIITFGVLIVECSAKHNRGVLEAFTEAARVSLTARPTGGQVSQTQEEKKKSSCVIL